MSSVLNNISKNESVYNKQLLIINSDNKKVNQTSSTFSNVFPITNRVSKLELIDANIPNTIYNISNANNILNINTTFLNGNTINQQLIVDDEEIKNNTVNNSNILDGTINLYNYITSVNSYLTDTKTKDLYVFTTGLFNNSLIDIYNTDNINVINNLDSINIQGGFVICYTIEQEFLWRFKIEGDLKYIKIYPTSEYVYVYGVSTNDIILYNITDSSAAIIVNFNTTGMFVCKYTLTGQLLYVFKIMTNSVYDVFLNITDKIYILSGMSDNITFYNKDNQIKATDIGSLSIASYDLTGNYIAHTSIPGTGFIIPTSLVCNDTIKIAINFEDMIKMTDDDVVISNGSCNICVAEFNLDLQYIHKIQIGGSAYESNAIISSYNDSIFICGNMTSKPLVFYNTNNTIKKYLTTNGYGIFISKYNNKLEQLFSFYINSDDPINIIDAIFGNNLYLSCTFIKNIKFNDISGYITGSDITNINTKSQAIIKYTKEGIFTNRIYNINSDDNCVLSLSKTKLFTVNNFITYKEYYNILNTKELTLYPKNTNNSILISFISNDTGIVINYDILPKTVMYKYLVEDEISLYLNVNAFSSTLGFIQSQPFIPTIFGYPINWKNTNINSDISTITIVYKIANISQTFDTISLSISINPSKYAIYTPYNLVYELNRSFSKIKNNPIFNKQTSSSFYFDDIKKTFYMRFNINGSFILENTKLSKIMGFDNTTSFTCVISNELSSNANIYDNTKLTLRLQDNIITEVVNNVDFTTAFQGINSLKIKSIENYNITANTSNTLSIKKDSNITFTCPLLPINNNATINPIQIDFNCISMSVDGKYQALTSTSNYIYLSQNYGVDWTPIFKISNWTGISMSSTGQYISAKSDYIYVSNNYGLSWSQVDSNRSWGGICVSETGQYQTALDINTYIYVSDTYGVNWNKRAYKDTGGDWMSLAISKSGQYQTALSYYIYLSKDYGNTWVKNTNTINNARNIAMSYDGKYQTLSSGDNIFISDNFGETWTLSIITLNNPVTNITLNSTGSIQFICTRSSGYVYKSENFGHTWNEFYISAEVIIQMQLSENENYNTFLGSPITLINNDIILDIYIYNYTKNDANTCVMSEDGKYQIFLSYNAYISNNYGSNWSVLEPNRFIDHITMNINGNIQLITSNNDLLKSDDYGITFNPVNVGYSFYWTSISVSNDGKYMILTSSGYFYVTNDYGITWIPINTFGSQIWTSSSVSLDGKIQLVVAASNFVCLSNDYGLTWTPVTDGLPVTGNYSSSCMSSDGQYQCIIVFTGTINLYLSNDSGITWFKSNKSGLFKVSISGDGSKLLTASTTNNIYLSGFDVDWLEILNDNSNSTSLFLSSSGNVSMVGTEKNVYLNLFTNIPINLTVSYVGNNLIFKEIPTLENRYILLNNFDMINGTNYTIKQISYAKVQNLFINSGNYTINSFITQVNKQITDINPTFINAFIYDTNTKKITFNPKYIGQKDTVLLLTNLLNIMGFTNLPENIIYPILSDDVINPDLDGSNSLYIKSDALGFYMQEKTISTNSMFNNVIGTLSYSPATNSFNIIDSYKNEVFLSKKINIEEVDITILNDKGKIVDLNGGSVIINIRLVKS